MTLVTIDLGDVAGGHHPDDHVIIRAEAFRESQGGGITSTAEVKIPLVDGVGQAEVEPGPVVVSFRCQAVADTREKRGVVPDSGTVGIEGVIGGEFDYTPEVVSQVEAGRKAAERAVAQAAAISHEVSVLTDSPEQLHLPLPLEDFEDYTWPEYRSPAIQDTFGEYFRECDGIGAVRTQIGTSGDVPLYAYTYGMGSNPHILLIGGTHPHERLAAYSARAFFTAFVQSNSPVFRALRNRARITLIPFLGASQIKPGTRTNSNGVDLNRNFPLGRSVWRPSDPVYNPGPAAFSETETQALKNFLDNTDVRYVIDCHNSEADAITFQASGAPRWMHAGDSSHVRLALDDWQRIYGNDGQYDTHDFGASIMPTLKAWVAKYLAWDLGRTGTNAVIIEGATALEGSQGSFHTAAGQRLYAGMIQSLVVSWLESASRVTLPPTPSAWLGGYQASDTEKYISEGGRIIPSVFGTPCMLNQDSPLRDYLSYQVPGPGKIVLEYDVAVEWVSGTPTVFAQVGHGPLTPRTAGNLSSVGRGRSQVMLTETSPSAVLTRKIIVEYSRDSEPLEDIFYMAQLFLHATGGQARLQPIQAVNFTATWHPDSDLYGVVSPHRPLE